MKNSPPIMNYLLLAGIALIWGSQFVFTELALFSIPPLTVAASRILVGALTLSLLAYCFTQKTPACEKVGVRSLFSTYFVISVFEAVLPFFLVAYGQQHVDSGLAAILMGTIPLFTLVFAATLIPGTKWQLPAILSVIVGFIGIITLVGPDINQGWNANLIGQFSILGAAMSFSLSLILLKKLPATIPPLISVRNIMLMASIPMVSLSLILDQPWNLPFTHSILLSLFVLGAFGAGIVYLMYMVLILRAGPTFASLSNYLVPPVGVAIGFIFMNEDLQIHQVIALIIILIALIVNQLKQPAS